MVTDAVTSAMSRYETRLDAIEAKGAMPSTSTTAVDPDTLFLSVLKYHPTIRREVVVSIVDGSFGVDDLWKLDSLTGTSRSDMIAPNPLTISRQRRRFVDEAS